MRPLSVPPVKKLVHLEVLFWEKRPFIRVKNSPTFSEETPPIIQESESLQTFNPCLV